MSPTSTQMGPDAISVDVGVGVACVLECQQVARTQVVTCPDKPYRSATASKRSGLNVPSVSMYKHLPSPPPTSMGNWQVTAKVWHNCVFPVRNSPKSSVRDPVSMPPCNNLSNSFEPVVSCKTKQCIVFQGEENCSSGDRQLFPFNWQESETTQWKASSSYILCQESELHEFCWP